MSFSNSASNSDTYSADSIKTVASSYSFRCAKETFSQWFTRVYDTTKPMNWWEHIVPIHGFLRGVPRYLEQYTTPQSHETDANWLKRCNKKIYCIGAQTLYLASIGVLVASLTYKEPSFTQCVYSSSSSLDSYFLQKNTLFLQLSKKDTLDSLNYPSSNYTYPKYVAP
ncbi:MAG: hypothetical protein ACOCQQ_00880 [Candidatus Nanoarchaeia archaeon]